MSYFVSVWIKFFFLLTPFFVLSMFLSLTPNLDGSGRRRLALRVTLLVVVISLVLYFLGNTIFALFGITLDAFRVGAGVLLFLSAVSLVRESASPPAANGGDMALVPLAMPIVIGPATTGALLVMGAEVDSTWQQVAGLAALLTAIACVGVMLLLSSSVERWIGKRGLSALSKITGLILSALAAQMIFAGARNLLAQ